MRHKINIKLTEKQFALLVWAVQAGFGQHRKFLRHDEWDAHISAEERRARLSSDRKFQRALDLLFSKASK